jgi:hypothetical protein
MIDTRTPQAAKIHAQSQLGFFGWSKSQWGCLEQLWTKESNWRPDAKNKTAVTVMKQGKRVKVYAGGIPQILGLDPKTSVAKQVNLGMVYIKSRYQSPCGAKRFWDRHNWY